MTEHFRKHDPEIVLTRLETRFEEFMERYERDQEVSSNWRVEFEKELATVKESIRPLLIPYRVMVGILTITGTAFLIKLVGAAFVWLKSFK